MMTMDTRRTLRDRVKDFTTQLPFMQDREKGENTDLLSQQTTIREYGFLTNDEGHDYAVFIVDERPKHFYFGGSVLTDRLQQLEAEGYHDDVNAEGLPMVMQIKKTRDGKRSYVNVEFYPE